MVIFYILFAICLIAIIIGFVFVFQAQTQETLDAITGETFPFETYVINLDRKPERYKYVSEQLNQLGIKNYKRVSAVDGFNGDPNEMLKLGVSQQLIDKGKGLAGCAASHLSMWRHIADDKLDWTLILEDDAHFHPDFIKLFPEYWKNVPKDAIIVFPGYCCEDFKNNSSLVISNNVMCSHGYMINWKGARYLLDALIPIKEPIDIVISNHFKRIPGSYIFNGNAVINGIRPNDYKESNDSRCMFNGIIYQNRKDQGSTIHGPETVF